MNFLIICGCYRSGTSIISIMLSHHPQLIVTDELWYFYNDNRLKHFNDKIRRLHAAYPNLRPRPFIPKNLLKDKYKEFLDIVMKQYPNINKTYFLEKLIEYSQRKPHYYGDKLPEYLFSLKKFNYLYNKPKVIMCLRDPRDIICSQVRRYYFYCKKMGSVRQNWWAKPNINAAIKMKRNWYTYINEWDSVKNKLDYYELDYNKLVENPELEAINLSLFLGICPKQTAKVFLKMFKPTNHNEWKTKFPNINKSLPKEWQFMMNKYEFMI